VEPFRRHVLYVPGYDPFPPRRYRELYRKEGVEQASISGYGLTLQPRTGDTYGWRVRTVMERPAEAEIEVLVWSDLVQGSMNRGVIGTYALLLRLIWIYGGSGALIRLLRLRKDLGLFANLRPAICYPALASASSLKPEVVEGLDILIVRELTGGVYFGEPKEIVTLEDGSKRGIDTQLYTTPEIDRICRVAFELARTRRNKVSSAEKHNVMKTGVLWKQT